MPTRTGPPTTAGRWSLLPAREPDATLRAHANAEVLLERHGVVTRGAVVAERTAGGFAAAYRVLVRLRGGRAGAARVLRRGARGVAVRDDGRGRPAAGDVPAAGRRARRRTTDGGARTVVLAAADPANPYGAALPWPEREGHRPGRKAGALVVLVDGVLVLYVERGGRTLLSWTEDTDVLRAAADALALAVHEGALGRLTVQRADGEQVLGGRPPAGPGPGGGRLPGDPARPAPARLRPGRRAWERAGGGAPQA